MTAEIATNLIHNRSSMTAAREDFLLIMPSYNQCHYIGQAVDSVLAQSDPNWVLWVIDNSTDATPELMKRYTDPRIHFVHIPARMDPGTCINWVLDREGHLHRDFSYIHTDNLLRSDYVSEMRRALSQSDSCIAYCDMKCLDGKGRYTSVFRRGSFDLARLFSLSSLGVPFSATTNLAAELGGFNSQDVADDVIFCIRAWPRARFVHIPDAIMDYRAHQDSRTTAHGGQWEMDRSFLQAYERLLPEMRSFSVDPLQALAQRMHDLQVDMQLKLEDAWYRAAEDTVLPESSLNLQTFFEADALDLFDLREAPAPQATGGDAPARGWKRLKGKIRKRWDRVMHSLQQPADRIAQQPKPHSINRRLVWEESAHFRHHAVPWLYLSAKALQPDDPVIRLASTDIHTLWITLVLHRMCGWRFQVDATDELNLTHWPQLEKTSTSCGQEILLLSILPGNIYLSKEKYTRRNTQN